VEAAGAGDGGPLRARLVVGSVAAVAIAAGHVFASGKMVNECIDPSTHARTLSQFPCPQAPASSPAEVAADAEQRRLAGIKAQIEREAVIADQQLVRKYPDEAAHRAAHAGDLDSVIRNIRLSAARFSELVRLREPLDDETAFYKGKPLPLALQRKIDANDASFMALTDVFNGLRAEVADVERKRHGELADLRLLWAGARRVDGALVMPTALSIRK
jgi:hypothetical protein